MMQQAATWTTIRTEGGLLPRDLLARVAAGDGQLPGMAPTAYHLAPNERLGEAINRSWSRLLGAWESFHQMLAQMSPEDRTATSVTRTRWSLLLFQELGFGQLQGAKPVELGGKTYPVSHRWSHVPIHLVGARVDLDTRTPGVAGAASMSPHALVQELLNRSDEHLWAVACNGLRLRLLRDNVALTRQAYVEFDLEAMFTGQAYADFAVLWLVCHQSRFESDVPAACILEQWVQEAEQRGTRALEQLRVGVEEAITALGEGFLLHRDNTALRQRLEDGTLDKQDYYRQLLRTVYRLLFLFVAEGRDLLLDPDADSTTRERYRAYYSIERLRTLAHARRGSRHGDQWVGLRIVMAALGRNGEPALGLPALGSFLWSDIATPDLDVASLDNRHLLRAIRSLSTTTDAGVTRPVDYRNLGSEELGSIYESLLELHPVIDLPTRSFALTTAGGHERKTTGSYYTPTSLINELLDSALEPVLDEAAGQADPEQALLDVTVLDPACGSGHFLIAAAHRIAKRLAAIRSGDDEPPPPLVQDALRDVVATCLHGIDVNEMAVELCKVSLWMEAMVPGRPLAFLDHRIVCGDALLGTTREQVAGGIPDEAFKALTGDDRKVVTSLKARNRKERSGQGTLALGGDGTDLQHALAEQYASIDEVPDDTAAGVAARERRWLTMLHSAEQGRAQLSADAWCAAFVAPKTPHAPAITTAFVRDATERPAADLDRSTVQAVVDLAREYQFLHLHLAFPHVFDGSGGQGFSCVLGNPPWERVKLQEKEFFAERSSEVAAAPNAAARKRLIAALEAEEPALFASFERAMRQAEGASHFLRSSGRFPLCGRGDVNTYTVFAEQMRNSASAIGRAGIIVPSGIATDDTTKHFFADLVETRTLVSLFDFENRRKLFPAVDSRLKFCLLTMSGLRRPIDAADFVFFALHPSDLADIERRFTLSPDDLRLLNPNTRTCPVFRSRRDAELTKSIYRRVPVLIEEGPPEHNPWGVRFSTMFHMSNDSQLFRTREQLETDGWELRGNTFWRGGDRYLPLYEAKMFHHFDHRWATYEGQQIRDVTLSEKQDPRFVVLPRYWVPETDTEAQRQDDNPFLVAFRDITNSTNERTMISALLPPVAAGNKAPLLSGLNDLSELPAVLSSFANDYVARFKIGGTTANFFLVKQLAVPAPEAKGPLPPPAVRSIALELTYTAWDLNAAHPGPPFRWEPERRRLLRAELDAHCFHLYGVERDDVDYIMDTFPIVKRKDEAEFGEYRTKRLILERYDAMAEAIATRRPYETVLDPPPADPSLCHPESTRPDWAKGN